jgi:hypothetical protein
VLEPKERGDGGGIATYVDARVQESQRKEALPWHRQGHHTQVNRNSFSSFCGKNATAYEKGVYFAVDANYSIDIYSCPDSQGNKYMYLARVDQPAMHVKYHDAQAYPEYLINIRRR